MYVRPSHQPRSGADVLEVIRDNPFATMVTSAAGGMIASHLPFMIDPGRGERGTLLAHMAAANPQSATIEDEREALVIFSGSHGYISPSWYEDRATAPTWNYVAVHCYGRTRRHSGEEALENIARLVAIVEARSRAPWSLADLAQEDVRALLRKVVSFEIPIARIEGKFKLGQGETRERNEAAVEQLEQQGGETLAAYMRRYNDL